MHLRRIGLRKNGPFPLGTLRGWWETVHLWWEDCQDSLVKSASKTLNINDAYLQTSVHTEGTQQPWATSRHHERPLLQIRTEAVVQWDHARCTYSGGNYIAMSMQSRIIKFQARKWTASGCRKRRPWRMKNKNLWFFTSLSARPTGPAGERSPEDRLRSHQRGGRGETWGLRPTIAHMWFDWP